MYNWSVGGFQGGPTAVLAEKSRLALSGSPLDTQDTTGTVLGRAGPPPPIVSVCRPCDRVAGCGRAGSAIAPQAGSCWPRHGMQRELKCFSEPLLIMIASGRKALAYMVNNEIVSSNDR